MKTAVLGSLIGIVIYSIGLAAGFTARWRLNPGPMTYSHHDGKETPMTDTTDDRHTISLTDPAHPPTSPSQATPSSTTPTV